MADDHSGFYTKDKALSKNFNLSDFVCHSSDCPSCNKYRYSETLIKKLEAMFDNYGRISSFYISSSYRAQGSGQHSLGRAVDIKWLDADGEAIDARYIAWAAQQVGFTGVAPLHPSGTIPKGPNSDIHKSNKWQIPYLIHLDVRGSFGNSSWYAYERDLDGDGYYEYYPTVPDGDFAKFYGLEKTELEAYMQGNGKAGDGKLNISSQVQPPCVNNFEEALYEGTKFEDDIYNMDFWGFNANCTVFFEQLAEDKLQAFYHLEYIIGGEPGQLEIKFCDEVLIDTLSTDFIVRGLLANTEYRLKVILKDSSNNVVTESSQVIFTTPGSYPRNIIKKVSLTKTSEDTNFNVLPYSPLRFSFELNNKANEIANWGIAYRNHPDDYHYRGFLAQVYIDGVRQPETTFIEYIPGVLEHTRVLYVDIYNNPKYKNGQTIQVGVRPCIVSSIDTDYKPVVNIDPEFSYMSPAISLRPNHCVDKFYLKTGNSSPKPLMFWSNKLV